MLGYLQFLKGSPMRSSSRQQAWLGMALCAAAMATVGSTVVASRLIAAGLPPFTATALRFAVATPVLWLLMRATGMAWRSPAGATAHCWCSRPPPAVSVTRCC